MNPDILLQICHALNTYLESNYPEITFRYLPEHFEDSAFLPPMTQFISDIYKDINSLDIDTLRDKYKETPEVRDELHDILVKYLDDNRLIQALYNDLTDFIKDQLAVTEQDVLRCAQALCRSEGGTWWDEHNIRSLPNSKATPPQLNQHWINKAMVVLKEVMQ